MGSKKLALFVFSLVLILSIISTINAELLISQPEASYNLGDELSFIVTTDTIRPGYLNVNLVCPGENANMNLYHDVPSSMTISIKRRLTETYISDLHGTCHLFASYDIEGATSQNFDISNSIAVSLDVSNIDYIINEPFIISGTAYKADNEPAGKEYGGFVQIDFNGNSVTESVANGKFSVNFKIPEITRAGAYSVAITVYEKDGEVRLSSGEATLAMNVIQIPSIAEIALDKDTIIPGEDAKMIPFVYDKAGDLLMGQVLMKIKDFQEKVLYEGYVEANQDFIFKTETNITPGYAKIIIQGNNLTAEKVLNILELRKINFEIKNDSLITTNAGNVPYKGIIEVQIGDEKVLKEVELEVNQKKILYLAAPKGEYEVNINDGNTTIQQSGVRLTGNVVSVSEINKSLNGLFYQYPIIWIFFFVVLAFFLYSWYKKRQKGGRIVAFQRQNGKIIRTEKKGGVEIVKPVNPIALMDKITEGGDIRRAEQVLVLHGKKQDASIIAIKIKNELEGIAKDTLTRAIELGYRAKAVSYNSGNQILLIFSPLLTKTFKNQDAAIKIAMDIEELFKDHNRKFRNNNIMYGIGVNSGDIINQLAGKVLQFTNMGKTVSHTKRIAELANEGVLLSKDIHEKTPNVKAEKVVVGGIDLFTVKRIVDHEQSAKFIQGFLRRNNPK